MPVKMAPMQPAFKCTYQLSLYTFSALIFLSCTSKPTPPEGHLGIPIAKVNDTVITDQDLMKRVEQIQEETPLVYSTHQQKEKLLQQMINIELLFEESMKRGFSRDYYFKAQMANAYIAHIAREARKGIRKSQIEKFYKENQVSFDEISARHILLKIEPGMSRNEIEALKKKITELRAQALEDPRSFARLAMEHSQDSTARNGGDLGFFSRPVMAKEFSDAAFALKNIGDISEVVRSKYGFHIIQLVGDKRGMDQHVARIKEILEQNSKAEILQREVEKLRSQKEIEIYSENLIKLSPLPEVVNQNPEEVIDPKMDEKLNSKEKK